MFSVFRIHSDGRVLDAELVVQIRGHAGEQSVAGLYIPQHQVGGQRGFRGAHAQMCKSWTSSTDGKVVRYRATSPPAMPSGTASSARFTEARSSPQVPARMPTAISMLTAGSSQVQPVARMARPASTTPS